MDEELQKLIQRMRNGDQTAVAELYLHFEPELRRFIRMRLFKSGVGRIFDSLDVLQSVFTNMYVRVMAGLFDVEHPQQLWKLLIRMARNKIIDEARRGGRASVVDQSSRFWHAQTAPDGSVSGVVANRELLNRVKHLLSEEERFIFNMRTDGRQWAEIGECLQKSGEAARKQMRKALDQVCKELG